MNKDTLYVKRKRPTDMLLLAAIYVSATLAVALLLGIILYVFVKGIRAVNWAFLTTVTSARKQTTGIAGNLLNTLYIIVITLLIATPIGVGSAIYLNEYAKPGKLVSIIEFTTETLSGIPSIIYGLVGMLIFCQYFGLKTSLLAGALTLTIMNLPTIIRTTQESLDSVPTSYREGAFGLGANKWYSIRTVVLPCCIDGIVTGCILAIGRMLGESAALLFTAGFAHKVNGFIDAMSSSGSTLTVALYVYAKEQGEFDVAFVIAAIMLFMSLLINYTASKLSKRIQNKRY